MSIVLSILKIIGWILLIALFIAVFCVLVLLFCPIRYVIEGEVEEEKWIKAKMHWFFHLFSLKVSYGDDLLYGEARLFWKKTSFSQDFTKSTEDKVETADKKNASDKQKGSMFSKIKGIIERIKELFPKIKKMFSDQKNKEAVIHLKNEIVYLIKMLLPKKSKVKAVFSTGSPDTTGQLFGVVSIFPVTYQDGWELLPDFESEDIYFKGTFWCKGKIYGFQIVGIILRILFDKNCKRLYTMISKFIEYLKKDSN